MLTEAERVASSESNYVLYEDIFDGRKKNDRGVIPKLLLIVQKFWKIIFHQE